MSRHSAASSSTTASCQRHQPQPHHPFLSHNHQPTHIENEQTRSFSMLALVFLHLHPPPNRISHDNEEGSPPPRLVLTRRQRGGGDPPRPFLSTNNEEGSRPPRLFGLDSATTRRVSPLLGLFLSWQQRGGSTPSSSGFDSATTSVEEGCPLLVRFFQLGYNEEGLPSSSIYFDSATTRRAHLSSSITHHTLPRSKRETEVHFGHHHLYLTTPPRRLTHHTDPSNFEQRWAFAPTTK